MDKRIAVTGADGFLGSRLVSYYQEAYDINPLNHGRLDITDEKEVDVFVTQWKPAVILHCAAIADTQACEENPQRSYAVNVLGTVNLAKACSQTGSKLILMSSDQIYAGSVTGRPGREEDETPLSRVYSRDKKKAEEAVTALLPDAVCLRLPWMYDFPSKGCKINSNFLCNQMKALIHNEPMTVPIHDYRGITWVWDVVRRMKKAMELPGGVYNFGSENPLSTYETAVQLMAMLAPGRKEMVLPDEVSFADHPRNLAMDTQKLKACGIKFPDTVEGMRQCLKKSAEYKDAFGLGRNKQK